MKCVPLAHIHTHTKEPTVVHHIVLSTSLGGLSFVPAIVVLFIVYQMTVSGMFLSVRCTDDWGNFGPC